MKRVATMASAIQISTQCMLEMQQGHPNQALRDCNTAVGLEPSFGPMYYDRAVVYHFRGEGRSSLSDLYRAIALQPTFSNAYALLCTELMNEQPPLLRAARANCDKAVRFGPRQDTPLDTRLTFFLHTKNYQGALADANALAKLHPNSALGFLPACEVYIAMQRYADARQSCTNAENASEDQDEGYLSATILATKMGDWEHALADAYSAVRLSPDNAETYNNRCWVRIRMNDVQGAHNDCEIALQLSHDSPHIRDTRADIRIRLLDYGGVIADEDSMIAGFPGSPYGYGGRCAAEQKTNDLTHALADCRRAVELDPYEGQWQVLLGNAYRAQGNLALARASYERARAIDPYAFEALREEAQLDEARGDAKSAMGLAASYVAKNEYDPVGRAVYGKALAALGHGRAALAQFNAAMKGYAKRHDVAAQKEITAAVASLKTDSHSTPEASDSVLGARSTR